MKVLLIITDNGSFNNFLSELTYTMFLQGIDVDIICSNNKIIDYEDKIDFSLTNVKFHHIEFPRGFNILKQLQTSYRIQKKINEIGPDLIHIHFTTGIFTTMLLNRGDVFTMGTFHGLGYPVIKAGLKKFVFKKVERFCFWRLKQIWLLNSFDFNLLKREYNNKVFLYKSLGLGCDLAKFDPKRFNNSSKINLRKQLGIDANDLVFAFTGRFVEFKGFALVVNSFLDLYLKNKNIKLLLMGGEDPIHKTGLSDSEHHALDTCEGIIKIGFTNEIDKYLSITDVFVFPSIKEGMPVCIIEALSMGIPVVTANARGCNDLIRDTENGILLSDNPQKVELVNALTNLINDNTLIDRMSNNALLERAKFDRKNYIKEQIDIYLNCDINIPN